MSVLQCDQIWQCFATLLKIYIILSIFEGLFRIGHNFEPTLAIAFAPGQIYLVTNGQIFYN